MDTWIVCITEKEARIYHSQNLEKEVSCVASLHENRTASGAEGVLGTIADEIEYACGEGTTGRLIVSGNPSMINRLCQKLDDFVRDRIIGIIPRNLCDCPPHELCALCGPFLKTAA